MIYIFPKIESTNEGSLFNQIDKIKEEVKEFETAFYSDKIERVTEEAVDILHAVETLLRMLEIKYDADIPAAIAAVQIKNRDRGYYSKSRGAE